MAAGVGVLTLIATVIAQIIGFRSTKSNTGQQIKATHEDTADTLAHQREHLDRTLREQREQLNETLKAQSDQLDKTLAEQRTCRREPSRLESRRVARFPSPPVTGQESDLCTDLCTRRGGTG